MFYREVQQNGGAEIASTGKCKYGKLKYKVAKCVRVENTSTENSSTAMRGWKTQVRKNRVWNNSTVTGNTTTTVKLQRQQLLHQQLLQFPSHDVAARENIAFVPCRHATFCKQCVETLVAVNGHCPIGRGPIDTTVQFYNN